MHREDNSKFLLYIEPKAEDKSATPKNDEISAIMALALYNAKRGTANYSNTEEELRFHEGNGWRGWHSTECGKHSTGNDYLLPNGMITNSLCVFYLMYYRDVIPATEMKKVNELCEWWKKNYVYYE